MKHLILIACGVAVAPGRPLDHSADRQERPASIKTLDGAADFSPRGASRRLKPAAQGAWGPEERPTADELLEALRRQRPANKVIPPASASGPWAESVQRALLPEGTALVSRTGRLVKEGRWWVYVFDPAEGEPAVRLLPNASLEVMVRTARGSASPVKFVVSGEVTAFQGENYLLVEVVRRSVMPDRQTDRQEGAVVEEETSAEKEPAAGEEAGKAGSTEVSAEDVLATLQRQQPGEEMIPVEQSTLWDGLSSLSSTDRLESRSHSRTLIADGSALMNRAGRLIRDGEQWTFAFESDHPDHPELPLKLLPCKNMELMLQMAERGTDGLVFVVSGEVTVFEGENFLLPRVAMRRIDTGNLGK